jgi:hypothetical protein
MPTPVAGEIGSMGKKVPLPIAGLDVGDELLGVEVLTGQIAVQQRVVLGLLDDRLENPAPQFLDHALLVAGRRADRCTGGVVHLLAEQVDQTGHGLTLEHGDLQGLGGTEGPLDGGDDGRVVVLALLELGQSDGAGHADRGALAPEHLGGVVDRGAGSDDEERGVGGTEPGADFTDEVGGARGVEQGDGEVAGTDGGHAQGRRGTLVGRSPSALAADQSVEERALAAAARSDEDDIADLSG